MQANNNTLPNLYQELEFLGVEKISRYSFRKMLAQQIADAYALGTFRQYSENIRHCNDFMIVRHYEINTNESGANVGAEIAYTHFCRCRLCPICAARRSLKAYNQLSRILDDLDAQRVKQSKKPYAYIFLSLTVRNCDGDALEETLDNMYAAYARMTRRSEWKSAIKGAWRTTEVTYNPDTCQFHPHMHVIALVNQSYFTSKEYISQAAFTELWRSSLQVAYTPVTHVVRADRRDGKIMKELTKYATKASSVVLEYSELPPERIVEYLHGALHGRKLFTAYGVIRKMQRALRLTDEDGDLLDGVTESDLELAQAIRSDLTYAIEVFGFITDVGFAKVDEWHLRDNPNLFGPAFYLVYKALKYKLDNPDAAAGDRELRAMKLEEYEMQRAEETIEFPAIDGEQMKI